MSADDIRAEDQRLALLLSVLDHIPLTVDFDQPYAVDLERMYARVQAERRDDTVRSPAQERETFLRRFALMEEEAFRMLQHAVAALECPHVDYALRQFEAFWREYRNQDYAHHERRVAWLRVHRESGKTGGRPPHNRHAIYADYDTWRAQGVSRPMVIARLAYKYTTNKMVMNRILRQAGRGTYTKNRTTRHKT